MAISNQKLKFWAENEYNVIFSGKHGVGKTSIIENLFNEMYGKDWLSFSAATMDPWVDFIGVPKEKTDENGNTFLTLVRPEALAKDQVKAIFFDEFNRCLTGDTLIQLAEGKSVPIRELVNRKEFFVYSYDTTNNKVAIGRGHSARKTENNANILKITLDNGSIIRCTEDHPFLLTTGKYEDARNLHVNDPLMSHRVRYNLRIISIEEDGYEDVYDITVDTYENFATGSGVFVHNSPKKVRNAVMELMQFKSINGHKFNNLKLVWAAINPPEEDDDGMVYDVEKIDPAQLDRFHIFMNLPYTVSKPYFKKKYGTDNGIAACDWWNSLSDGLKGRISPRRLDYAMDIWSRGGDVKDILPKNVPTTELMKQLNDGPYNKRIKNILKGDMTNDEISKELADESLFKVLMEKILSGKEDVFEKLVPMLEDEKMLLIFSKMSPSNIRNGLNKMGKNEKVYNVLKEATNARGNGLTHAKKNSIDEWINSNYEVKGEIEKIDVKVGDEVEILNNFMIKIKSNGGLYSSHERLERFNELATFFSHEDAGRVFLSQDNSFKNTFWVAFNKLLRKSNKPRVEAFIMDHNLNDRTNIVKNLITILADENFTYKIIGYARHNPRMEILLNLLRITLNDMSDNISMSDFIKKLREK